MRKLLCRRSPSVSHEQLLCRYWHDLLVLVSSCHVKAKFKCPLVNQMEMSAFLNSGSRVAVFYY